MRREKAVGTDNELQGATMTLQTAILSNALLDLAVVLALAATTLLPFSLDRREDEAVVYGFAAPLPEELAA